MAKMNAIDPHSAMANQLSAEMMEAMNNYDGAVVELKRAVEMAPHQPGSHYKLGDAYFSPSQLDSPAEQFQAGTRDRLGQLPALEARKCCAGKERQP